MNRIPPIPEAVLTRNPAHYRRLLYLGLIMLVATQTLFATSNLLMGFAHLVVLPAAHVVWCLALGVFIYYSRGDLLARPAVRAVIVALGVAPVYLTIWLRHTVLASSGLDWIPFQGIKLMVIGLGIVVPGPYWLHVLLIAAFAVEALLLWSKLDLAVRANVSVVDEPMFTMMFIVVALGLLAFRWQHDVLERRMLALELRAAFVSRMAHLFLRVRDQFNTPLQTLRSGIALLEARNDLPPAAAERMQRAVDRLAALNNEFVRYEKAIRWTGDELEEGELDRWLTSLEPESPESEEKKSAAKEDRLRP